MGLRWSKRWCVLEEKSRTRMTVTVATSDERLATGDGAMGGISGQTERCSDLIFEVSLLLSAVVQRR